MSKYSHYEMCEKIFGQRYKCNEQKQDYELYSRTDMWNKLIEQQDKIAELKQQLADTEESYNNAMKYLNKTRSELLNLPKKIVEDIKEWIKSQIIYCGGKADEVDILIANASNQVLEDLQNILDTILKKYEGD